MKLLNFLLYGLVLFMITGCNSIYELNNIDGIKMFIKEGTLSKKGVTVVIEDINGKGTYVYGESFTIEKKENNNWVNLKETNNNCGFNLMAYYVNDNGLLEFNQNWECMYGELEKGTYRLVKSTFLSSSVPVGKEDEKYFSVEFTIE